MSKIKIKIPPAVSFAAMILRDVVLAVLTLAAIVFFVAALSGCCAADPEMPPGSIPLGFRCDPDMVPKTLPGCKVCPSGVGESFAACCAEVPEKEACGCNNFSGEYRWYLGFCRGADFYLED